MERILDFGRTGDGEICADFRHESGRVSHFGKDPEESEAHFVGRCIRYVTDHTKGKKFTVRPLTPRRNIEDTGTVGG